MQIIKRSVYLNGGTAGGWAGHGLLARRAVEALLARLHQRGALANRATRAVLQHLRAHIPTPPGVSSSLRKFDHKDLQ